MGAAGWVRLVLWAGLIPCLFRMREGEKAPWQCVEETGWDLCRARVGEGVDLQAAEEILHWVSVAFLGVAWTLHWEIGEVYGFVLAGCPAWGTDVEGLLSAQVAWALAG